MSKTAIGTIVKKSGTNTVKVLVRRKVTHPIYKKQYNVSKHFLAHTTKDHEIGETVIIIETRPISKLKHFEIKPLIEEGK